MSELKQNPIAFAEENSLEIIEPADNELQLDIDKPEDLSFFKDQVKILRQFFDIKRISYTTSKSGNTHVYIVLADPIPFHQRLALQACLGSDRKRELLTFKNQKDGLRRPMFLYEVIVDSGVPSIVESYS